MNYTEEEIQIELDKFVKEGKLKRVLVDGEYKYVRV